MASWGIFGSPVYASRMRPLLSSSLGLLGGTHWASGLPAPWGHGASTSGASPPSAHHHVMRLDKGTEDPGLSLWFFQGSSSILSGDQRASVTGTRGW